MNFLAGLKKAGWIVAGGITGALLLVGASLVLILLVGGDGPALPYFGVGHIIEKWKQTWTSEGICIFFFAVGIVGFALGGVMGWRHSQIVKKWFAPTLTFAIPIILFLWMLNNYASHVTIPREMKLTDCTSNNVFVQFIVPKGKNYRLALAAPSSSTNIISGRVSILNGTIAVTNFPIGSNKAENQCDFFRAGVSYNVEITFDQPPPSSTAIWLHWLQAYRDRNN
jgi:hypothetical protein